MRYFNNAIFIAIMIAVVIKLFGGEILNIPAKSEASPTTIPAEIRSISAGQLAKIVFDPPAGKPTFVMIYASWCPYCKRQFPQLEEIAAEYHDSMNFVSISIDKNPQDAVRFLADKTGNTPFGKYVYSERNIGPLVQKLGQMGAHFNGGIPFMALFSGNGKLTAEFGGLTDKKNIAKEIEKNL